MATLNPIPIREPAVLIKDPNGTPSYFWPKKEFMLKPVVDYFNVDAAHQATAEKRIKSLHWEIDTQFVGEFEYLPLLWPHLASDLGASILGTTDADWRLITQSGRQWDFPRGGFIKRPNIVTVPGQTIIGQSTFAAVCASDKQPGESGAFWTYSGSGTWPGYSSYDASKILTLVPKINFGSYLVDAQFEGGCETTPDWQIMPFAPNGLIRDWTLTGQELTTKGKPYGLTFPQIATMCGYEQAMGSQLPTDLLTISFGGFYLELRNATVEQAQFKLSPAADFIDGLVWRASQGYSAGAQVAPALVDEAPPEP